MGGVGDAGRFEGLGRSRGLRQSAGARIMESFRSEQESRNIPKQNLSASKDTA